MAIGTDEELDAILGLSMPTQTVEQPTIQEKQSQIPARQVIGSNISELDAILGLEGLPSDFEVKMQEPTGVPVDKFTDTEAMISEEPHDFSFIEMLKNVPKSAAQFGEAIIQPIIHPVQTAETLTQLAVGGAQKLMPEPADKLFLSPQGRIIQTSGKSHKRIFDAFTQSMSDRYGGWDNIQRTIETDPVGFLGDASILFGGAAGVFGKGAKAAKMIEPLTLAKNIVAHSGNRIGDAVAKKLYNAAFKMTTSKKVTTAKRAERVKTGLGKAVMPTKRSKEWLDREIRRADLLVQRTVNRGSRKGDLIDIEDIMRPVEAIKKKAQHSLQREAVLQTIDEYKKILKSHPDAVGNKLPAKAVNEVKKQIWHDLKGKFGEAKSLEIEAVKSIGRGARMELEGLYPQIKGLNVDSGAMRGLRETLEQTIKRLENRNVLSLSDIIVATGAGAAAGPGSGMGALVLKKIITDPQVQAATAIAVQRAGQIIKPGARGAETLKAMRVAGEAKLLNQ